MSKASAREVLDKLKARTQPADDPYVQPLVARIEKVLALIEASKRGEADTCCRTHLSTAKLERLLNGED